MNTFVIAPTLEIRVLLCKVLQDLGLEVEAHADAGAAWEATTALNAPLVLVEMPNGYDHTFGERFKRRVEPERSLLVAVIDSAQPATLEAVLEAGADELLDLRQEEALLTASLTLATRRAQRRAERAATREAMEASEETLHLFADTIPGMIYLCCNDEHYTMLYVNEAVEALTGYGKEDFLSGKCQLNDLIHPDDRTPVRERESAAMEAAEPFHLRYRLQHRSGAWRTVEETGTGVFVRGEPVYLEGFISDVTEQEKTEARLHRSELYFRSLFEGAPIGMAVTDPQGHFVEINEAYADMLGYARDELVGRPFAELTHPADRASNVAAHRALVAGERDGFQYVKRYMHRDGRAVWVRLTATLVPDSRERSCFDMAEDVTAQREAEEALRELEREVLEISSREQRRIGRDLHDGLGSHLTGLAMRCRGLARRLEHGRPVEKEEMDALADLMQEGITQARHLARGLNPVKLDREGLVSALQDLSAGVQAQTGTPCTFTATPLDRPLDSEAAAHLYRIAQEALNNAAKHARAEALTLHLVTTPSAIVLEIQDDGVGLRREEDRTDGMGLRVMHYRARIIGATLSIESTEGEGTTITCTLPLASINHEAPAAPAAQQQ